MLAYAAKPCADIAPATSSSHGAWMVDDRQSASIRLRCPLAQALPPVQVRPLADFKVRGRVRVRRAPVYVFLRPSAALGRVETVTLRESLLQPARQRQQASRRSKGVAGTSDAGSVLFLVTSAPSVDPTGASRR